MSAAAPAADLARHDVRMDGVYFMRASLDGPFARALEPGAYSYCVMVRRGRMRLETDFPHYADIALGPSDAVAVSGLAPHVFRSIGPSSALAGRFALRPMNEAGAPADVDLVVGVAPSEALALGSLMVAPILVRAAEHLDLSRRLWAAVAMLEDEYADAASIDRNLVVRRLAEVMLINFSRRMFVQRRPDGGPREPASRPVIQAINAFLREPDRPWALGDLARTAGMSRSRFAEEFKLVTGQTPGRVVARMRLTAIARRLASEPLSVEAAAEEAGYSSSAAFVRAFQRAFGETPARWRRRRADRGHAPSHPSAIGWASPVRRAAGLS